MYFNFIREYNNGMKFVFIFKFHICEFIALFWLYYICDIYQFFSLGKNY